MGKARYYCTYSLVNAYHCSSTCCHGDVDKLLKATCTGKGVRQKNTIAYLVTRVAQSGAARTIVWKWDLELEDPLPNVQCTLNMYGRDALHACTGPRQMRAVDLQCASNSIYGSTGRLGEW